MIQQTPGWNFHTCGPAFQIDAPKKILNCCMIFWMNDKNVMNNESKLGETNNFEDHDVFEYIINLAKHRAERTVQLSS